MPPGGIRKHHLSRWATADLHLRPRGHWDRPPKRLELRYLLNAEENTLTLWILKLSYIIYRGLRRCATSRTVQGSIPGGVTWDFFRGSFQQNPVPWGWLSFWKWVPGLSPGIKAAGAFGWRPTLVVPKVEKIRGLTLPGTPRATSACRGIPLLYFCIIYK